MTRFEMIAAVQRLSEGAMTEVERDALIGMLVRQTPHAGVSDLIYYPDKKRSAEEIVDEALRRERSWRASHA